ncbi:hypothetical protein BASA62_010051 [Batrachochytrium salamandrivorans]|nr:hypothetical protein BASA62_010051 [Batrachochytrium salamandrivorans]
MVTVSLFLALALVSSTVVAQPGTNGLASLFACFKQQTTSEISIKSVYEWISPSKTAPAPTSNRNSLKIGLKYILQKLNLRSNQFKGGLASLIILESPICMGYPSTKDCLLETSMRLFMSRMVRHSSIRLQ